LSERRRFGVLGVFVDAVDYRGAVGAVEGWIDAGARHYVCVANVHGVMEAHRDETLRAVYNGAGLSVPDGMPLVWVGRLKGEPVRDRVYGPDLTLELCALAARRGFSCYFYGGAEGVAERLGEALQSRFPGMKVAGWDSPPFRALTEEEQAASVDRVNRSRPDIVFVGLGCPKQERWMAAHRPRLRAPALVGVGAAFDFHTGRLAQAPAWMQSRGLEWVFRLVHEPRRLWYRYLVFNSMFVLRVACELAGLRRYPSPPQAAARTSAPPAGGRAG
jgi:N-acetylglucosaminyldiphosphoundecaprenol N-acetyl-beta-D-mannosaminyltransferase